MASSSCKTPTPKPATTNSMATAFKFNHSTPPFEPQHPRSRMDFKNGKTSTPTPTPASSPARSRIITTRTSKTSTPAPAPGPKPSTDFEFNHKMAELAQLQHCKLRAQQLAQAQTQAQDPTHGYGQAIPQSSNPQSRFPLHVEPALNVLYTHAESKFAPYPTYDGVAAQHYPPRAPAPTQEVFQIDYKNFDLSASSRFIPSARGSSGN